jgi:lipopolysaccharide biosynthesis glycosyltransferase
MTQSSHDPRQVHIALCCDHNVADGVAATLVSAYRHLDARCSLHVHIVDFGLGAQIQERLRLVARRLPRLQIEFIAVATNRLSQFPFPPRLQHVTLVTYARLLLHNLLPDLEKVIYLDCDLLVNHDLARLWQIDLGDKPLAATVDLVIPTIGHEMESLAVELPELDPQLPYLNGGVLLLNLSRLRNIDASSLYTKAVKKISVRFGDQSVLNAAFAGQWKVLPPNWNRGVFLLPTFNYFRDRPATIWHVFMGHKPWHFHREGSSGLVADYYRLLDSVNWAPTAPSLIRAKPRDLKDLAKAGWAALQRRWHSIFSPS